MFAVQTYGLPSFSLPFGGSRVVQPVDPGPEVVWAPQASALTEGSDIGAAPPSTLGWSEDGTQLGWRVFDESRGARVAYVTTVTDTFSEPEIVRPSPLWVAKRWGPVNATSEDGLLVLTHAKTRRTELLDPRALLGAVNSELAVATSRGDQLLVAFVARPTLAEDAPYRIHVMDVTDLLSPPKPAVPEPSPTEAAAPADAAAAPDGAPPATGGP